MDEHLVRPDATLAYSTEGPADAGRTAVVAHALAVSRKWEDDAGIFDWRAVTEVPARLVRFDTRGHGESTGAPIAEEYRWPALARDLLAVADVVSPDAPVDGVGESTGCGVVLWAAHLSPGRFRRLVLAIPPTYGAARVEQAGLYRAAASMIEVRGIESYQRLQAVAPPPPILREGGWTRASDIAVPDDLLPSVLRGAAGSVLPTDDALAEIDPPTLILAWDADPSHPLTTAEHLVERLPNASVDVARTPEDVRGWGRRAAAFLALP
ncbi:MAG TPA: alpha/beta fold hydrolase [Amnibacterium sp.]|nr:alpha/beta fold hydrolase [Amnibacterium sp.]